MNVFELCAVLKLNKDSYEEGLDDAERKSTSIGSKISSGVGTVAKGIGVAVAGATVAVGALVKASVEAYSEYEQLVGGVETLFKESSSQVMQYANNAYKTAGLSANEYMETVTSFSASLLQSLNGDTKKSAEVADLAITDMADNANKMGTSMESIQNAYQGFAKQNYTMLDNLKLGYGGTKEEMERLLADAEKISGQKFDLSNYADVVEAIHVVQTEMGITGTTAKEASSTIQGSVASMKSAWQNLVTGMADSNADIGQLVDNLIESVGTVADNMIPVISQALEGIGEAMSKLIPQVFDKLPSLLGDTLPKLINSAVKMLENVLESIKNNKDKLKETISTMITAIVNAIVELTPVILDVLPDIIVLIVETLVENLPQIIMCIVEATGTILAKLGEWALQLLSWLGGIIGDLASKLWNGLVNIISNIVEWGVNLKKTIDTAMGNFFSSIWNTIKGLPDKFLSIGKDIMTGLWNGIKSMWDTIVNGVKNLGSSIVSGLKNVLGIHSPSKETAWIGQMLDEGLQGGIDNYADSVLDSAEGMSKDVLDTISGMNDDLDTQLNGNYDMNVTATASGATTNPLTEVLELLKEWLPSLSGQQVVMDTGALVGQLVAPMDTALGKQLKRTERSTAW